MFKHLVYLIVIVGFISCNNYSSSSKIMVGTTNELQEAIKNVSAGDEIVLKKWDMERCSNFILW